MIIANTNIISELMKVSPSTKMINWLDRKNSSKLYVTTITIAEISYGLNAMSTGIKKQRLEISFDKAMRDAFSNRIISFTDSAALVYGKIMAYRKKIGRPLSVLDGQIASIALTHAATLATRNINDFLDCELDLVNPFD